MRKFYSVFNIGTITSAVMLGLLCWTPTHAGLITFGTGVLGGTENVTGWTQLSSTTASGDLAGNPVILATTDAPLQIPAAGQARIQRLTDGTPFTWVMFDPITIPGFFGIELNVDRIGGSGGTFTLTAIDNNSNSASNEFSFGPGENRVWVQGMSGAFITKLTVTASDALINNVSQVRLSAVPEPTALLLVGSMIGLGAFRRRR